MDPNTCSCRIIGKCFPASDKSIHGTNRNDERWQFLTFWSIKIDKKSLKISICLHNNVFFLKKKILVIKITFYKWTVLGDLRFELFITESE